MGAQGLYYMERFYYVRRVVWGLIIFWILFALWATGVFAAPFATCDCTPAADNVTGFQIRYTTTGTPVDVPAVLTCGSETACVAPSARLCVDLAPLPQGPYVMAALAKNVWGVSDWSAPLAGSKSLPTSPSHLKITQ